MTFRWWEDPKHEPRGFEIVSSHNHLPTGKHVSDAQAFRERAIDTMRRLADELDEARAEASTLRAHVRALNESRRVLMARAEGEDE